MKLECRQPMRIAFRTDASIEIGTGHVMRCLTLADELRLHGAECVFVCRPHHGNLLNLINQRGHTAVALPLLEPDTTPPQLESPKHANWLKTDWVTDADDTKNVLSNWHYDWLVVDHYALDFRWERSLRPSCIRLMVIDDLADRTHDCDLLLDQNLGRTIECYAKKVSAHCKILTGPDFALLRPEFYELRNYSLQRRKKPALGNLLISMGGVDLPNSTSALLTVLRSYDFPANCRISVIMGATAPKLDQVLELAKQMPCPTEVHVGIPDMARKMAECDLAIGAAGSSSWERCCLGVPSIVLVLAENQKDIASALNTSGAALVLDIENIHSRLPNVLDTINTNSKLLAQMSKKGAKLCNGLGGIGVAGELLGQ